MCGIVGFLEISENKSAKDFEALALAMARTISHRGPDGDGAYVEPECGLALGHRRLSIIDLSEAGSQPMHSRDERLVIVFNGEIYNHKEMRTSLEQSVGAIPWKGYSDTEVLLEAIAEWGIEKA